MLKNHIAWNMFKQISKLAPQPVKKEGVTVIEKNGKTYVYSYKKRNK